MDAVGGNSPPKKHFHDTILRLLISTPNGRYTDIQERSDGLRQFVALATFAEVYGLEDRDLVLLY